MQYEHYKTLIPDPEAEPTDYLVSLKRRYAAPTREVFGYHPYWMGTAWQNYNYNLLSTIAYFGVAVNGNGQITDYHGWPVTSLINEAHSHGVEVVLTVILFSGDQIQQLLSSSSNRQTLISNLLTQVGNAGADGVNIDFEGVPSSQKNNLTTFMTDLTNAFHNTYPGSQVTMATPAVDWPGAFDYNALAQACDGLMIMGYAYHWGEGPTAGPVSPLTGWGTYNITWTVNDYLTKTNGQADKIILGLPYYGYEWPTVSGNKGAATTGSGDAKFYSEASVLAESYGRLWDDESKTPWYRYQNPDWFQGWYDDSLSLSYKYDLAIDEDLKGIGIWALGYDGSRPELWGALSTHFGATSPPTIPTNLSIINDGDGTVRIDFSASEISNEFRIYRWYPDSDAELMGNYLNQPILLTNLTENEIYYIQVSAANEHGESPLTEVLGVIPTSQEVSILIVNGFDRVNGTNNTFDFIRRHGPAIQSAGHTFDACSNETISSGRINLEDYFIVDWILGEEGTATSSFSANEQLKVGNFLESGGALIVSGSEIGYDLVAQGNGDDLAFYTNYLKSTYISDAAGGYQGVYEAFGTEDGIFTEFSSIAYDNGSHGTYDVDYPDGIQPEGGSEINLKYSNVDYSSRGGAGVQYIGTFGNSQIPGGIVHLAIPFETIYPSTTRNALMDGILNYFFSNLKIVDDPIPLPRNITIANIYPNPANLSVNFVIRFPLGFDYTTKTTIKVIDILGRIVAEIPLPHQSNNYEIILSWDGKFASGKNAPSGVYTAFLQTQDFTHTRKFTLLK